MSKYKNIFAKSYTPKWSEEVFGIKKVKQTVPWTYVISDLRGEEIVGMLHEEELYRQIKQRVIKKKKSRGKVIKYMLSGEVMVILSTAG